MPYHLSTNDDITSYFLIKNNAARRNQRNSTKYIQLNFIKYNQNNNNTSITSPSSRFKIKSSAKKRKKNTNNSKPSSASNYISDETYSIFKNKK